MIDKYRSIFDEDYLKYATSDLFKKKKSGFINDEEYMKMKIELLDSYKQYNIG